MGHPSISTQEVPAQATAAGKSEELPRATAQRVDEFGSSFNATSAAKQECPKQAR